MWDPLAAVARGRLLEHAIDLLETETLGLGDQEVRVDEAGGAQAAPEEEDLGAQVAVLGANHVGGDDADDAVPEPVAGGGEADAAGADGDGEDLADDDPGAGAPGGGEEEDVDADEGDEGAGGVVVAGQGGADGADDELADDHAQRAPDEDGAAAEALHGPEGDGGGAHVDEREDEGDEEGVRDGAQGLEEDGGVVEDEVHPRPLLHHPAGGG